MITVILNCYKRPEYLKEQIEAIKSQTIPPEEIIVWYNKPEEQEQYDLSNLGANIILCDKNYKFHGRFTAALMAKTKYVAIFDDDTIPGKMWFENCLSSMKKKRGIYGTSGVVLHGDKYLPNHKVGWNGKTPNEEIVQVDLVGHMKSPIVGKMEKICNYLFTHKSTEILIHMFLLTLKMINHYGGH
jgi:hypothetical protein